MIELVSEVGVSLIQTNATDDMVAMAAWVSHDQDSEDRLVERDKVGGLINFLYRNKHMSPFEHGQFTFKIDVPLFVAREFHRHRTFSYNEVSGRYTEMKPRFWIGEEARIQGGKPGDYYFESATSEQTALYLQKKRGTLDDSWAAYEDLLASGIAKEQAREVLPVSLMTQFYATVNSRNLMAFLSLRNEKHALKEIQAVAVKMEEIFAEQMPLTYAAYVKAREPDTGLIDRINELEVQLEQYKTKAYELDNKLVLVTAEAEALGKTLLEVQQDCIAEKRKAEQWERMFHSEENVADKWKEKFYSERNDAAYIPPQPKPTLSVIVNDILGDPSKISEKVLKAIDNLEKRNR